MEILKKAWNDTIARFSLSLGTAVQSVLVPAAFVVCIHLLRGEDAAMTEAADILLYIAAFFGVAVIPAFLWNLWLAPYRLMRERLEKAIVGRQVAADSCEEPQPVDVSLWEGTLGFPLGDAACLWVGVRPHEPIRNTAAMGVFSRLKGAMMTQAIPYPVPSNVFSILFGGRIEPTPWPEHSTWVSSTSLRKYADTFGNVPLFLQSVDVPPNPQLLEQREADRPNEAQPNTRHIER